VPLADGFQTTLRSVTRAVDRLQTDSTRTLADIDGLANESVCLGATRSLSHTSRATTDATASSVV